MSKNCYIFIHQNQFTYMNKRTLDILHLADIQVRVTNSGADKDRYDEYQFSLKSMSNILAQRKPDILIIPGDIFEVWDANGDEVKLFADFMHACLPHVSRIIIVPGNHDLKSRNNLILSNSARRNQTDIIQSTVISINSDKISYYDVTGFHNDTVFPITWAVWSHKYKLSSTLENSLPYSPYQDGTEVPDEAFSNIIELFHDPIANCIGFDGTPDPVFKDYGITLANFNSNTIIAGDIHSPMITWFGEANKRLFTYSSSLVQRNFGEGNVYFDAKCAVRGNEQHGYNIIQFDLDEDRAISCEFVKLPNPVSRHTIRISKDFNWDRLATLNYEATKFNRIKVIIQGNVAAFIDNESKLIEHLQSIAPCSIVFEYAADAFDMLVDDSLITSIESIADHETILRIATKYIEDVVTKTPTIAPEDKEAAIEFILSNLRKELDKVELLNAQSNISLKSGKISNFMSFREDVEIDFKDKKITKIGGTNGVGKTTIFSFILWMLTDLISEHQTARNKNTNYALYFNDSSVLDEVLGTLVFSKNGDVHILEKTLTRNRKKNGDVSGYTMQLALKSAALCSDDTTEITEYLQSQIFTFDELNRSMFVNQRSLTDLIKTSSSDLNARILKNIGVDFFTDMLAEYDELRANLIDKLEKPSLTVEELLTAKALNETTIIDTVTEITTLNENKDNIIIEIDKTVSEIDTLKLQLNNVGTVEEVERKITTKETEIQSNDTKIINDESALKAANENLEASSELAINKELSAQQAIITAKESALELHKSKLESANATTKDKESATRQTTSIIKSELESGVTKITAEISANETKIANLQLDKQSEIKEFNDNIETEANVYRTEIEALQSENAAHASAHSSKLAELATLNTKLSVDLVSIENLNEKINKLVDTTTCPTCQGPLSKEKLAEIEAQTRKLADECEPKQKQYSEDAKTKVSLTKSIEELSARIDKINADIDNKRVLLRNKLDEKVDSLEHSKYDISIDELTSTNARLTDELAQAKTELIDSIKKDQRYIDALQAFKDAVREVTKYEAEIESLVPEIATEKSKLEPIQQKLKNIEALKNEAKVFAEALQLSKDAKIRLESELESVKRDLDKAEWDKQTNELIKPLNETSSKLNITLSNTKERIAKEEVHLSMLEKNLTDFDKRIENAKRYKLVESSMKLYKKMLGQSGLPQYIFAHIIPILNKNLNELLEDVDFRLQFDSEDLVLKFHDVKKRTVRPVMFISGMESCFAALALVDVIRRLNNARKTKELFIDEISGQLNSGKELSYEGKNFQSLVVKLLTRMSEHSNIYIIDHVLNLHEARVIEVCPSDRGSYIKEV